MPHRQDRLIQWLLGSLDLQTTLFHVGQYCGSWQASTTGLARAGFHVLLNGDCWLHLPATGQKHALQAGDAVFFLRDVPHLLSPHAEVPQATQAPRVAMQALDTRVPCSTALACGFFEFRAPLNRVFLSSFPDYVIVSGQSQDLQEVRPLFELILAEARRSGAEPSPLITRLVDLMFFYVVRHLCQRQDVSAGLWAVLARPEFTPLLEAIVLQPGHDWTVEAMAGLSCMSRTRFFKCFSATAGTSPSHFLAQIRMKLATQRIEEGMSLSKAAESVGYQSDAAFSRAFKKITGTLPGTLRRSQQAAERLTA
ncbi:MAG: AraC family transcriptional regulator [Burkholderiaceae bacterium]|nr:AraC family transcriptional regulator [Burkholderiaceae bacterium]